MRLGLQLNSLKEIRLIVGCETKDFVVKIIENNEKDNLLASLWVEP